MDFSSDMVFRNGTGKPIPYRVRRNAVVRCKTGFLRTFDTGQAQKSYRHNFNAPLKCLPLEGKVSAQPTDEVFFSSAGKAFALNQHNFMGCETLWFVPLSRYRAGAINVYVHSQSATEKTTPQSASLTAPLTQGRQGKRGARSAPHLREAAVYRFCLHLRHRVHAINVSAGASVRL